MLKALSDTVRAVVALPFIGLGWFFLWAGAWIQPSLKLRQNVWSSMFFFSLQCKSDEIE